jgi:hypothetical protein
VHFGLLANAIRSLPHGMFWKYPTWNEAGLEILAPAAEGVLQRWPVSKRVNSSKAPKDDETLTQPVDVVAPQLQV